MKRVSMMCILLGVLALRAAPVPKDETGGASIGGIAPDGKEFKPATKDVRAGAEAVEKVIAGVKLTDFLDDRSKPFDDKLFTEWAAAWIKANRPHVRVKFDKPRTIEVDLNGAKQKLEFTEILYFEAIPSQPPLIFARKVIEGDARYYFANRLGDTGDLTKWFEKAAEKEKH